MIKVKNLLHKYGKVLAVDRVSFEVSAGEVACLIGPNGAGKTTIVNILAGVVLPEKGEVSIGGFDIFKDTVKAKKITAYVPEQPYLWGKITGEEFLLFMKKIYQSPLSEGEIAEISQKLGIYEYRKNLIETYSHGMKQKLLLLTVPLIQPKVILMDEPLVGLDLHAAGFLTGMIKDFAAKGTSVFISTHSIDFAEKISSKIFLLSDGKIILDGTVKNLTENFSKKLEEVFLERTRFS